MRNRYAAALFGVVYEVRLGVVRSLVADNFNCVLVGADCAVGTQPEEHGAEHAGIVKLEFGIVVYRIVRDIIDNSD